MSDLVYRSYSSYSLNARSARDTEEKVISSLWSLRLERAQRVGGKQEIMIIETALIWLHQMQTI